MPAKKTKVTPEDVTTPQIEEQKKENINDPGKVPEDAVSIPQTDIKKQSDEAEDSNALDSDKETAPEEPVTPHTETSNEPPSVPDLEDAEDLQDKTDLPQTDGDFEKTTKSEPDVSSADQKSDAPSQNDMGEANQISGMRNNHDDLQNQSDTTDKSESDMPTPRRAESEKARLRITLPKRENIISIDEELEVVTDRDKAKSELLYLLESYRGKKHLSGKIQGIENPTGEPSKSLAVLAYGEYKVIIPLYEAVEPPDVLKGQSLDNALSYMLNKRLGAEIDYIVKGIDAKEKIVVGSRVEAMRNKRKNYYFGTDRDGNYILYSDLCAEVRVVSVVRSGIFVDLFGLEVFIPLSELSYQRMMDAESYFAPGQRTLVKILEVDRRDRRNLRVRASVKQAGENPYEKALRKYVVGNRYVGTVSLVDVNGVFVSLDGGIDCLCNYPKRGRPPKGARVTIRVLGINHNTNRMWGAITHIAAAR